MSRATMPTVAPSIESGMAERHEQPGAPAAEHEEEHADHEQAALEQVLEDGAQRAVTSTLRS